ncbi:hypothetical protein M431DRAFT_478451 [Trichoderma harzianum CBS 226.95]|uniref:Uncharacterized protein n=1 Tax=Trichoderma harzianum CBS 226.95 TaxID=983964 RepID=A0A2T4AQN5_TRIHA|nr:hypothetical protein M431DRAFT_478451 [Trichoderma harzianum CBS 226.95]PTB59374.1 hypothetical protein M431DRAFT_478451 [Trichoderma harzianum CBS 226.95]
MASHRHNPSLPGSIGYHHNQCRNSGTLPSASQFSPTDLIPSWLQHVQASDVYNDTSREIFRQASPGPEKTFWHPNGIPTVHIQSKYNAGRYQASDVFIQDTPSPPSLTGQTSRHLVHEPYLNDDYDKVVHNRKGHSTPKAHVSMPSGVSLADHSIFEKQARRKTRKDRYNTVKIKDARRGKQQAKRSSTRVSKNGRLRSSREIMANFTSSAITHPNERITLKPSFTPGLFVNGRSSVPQTDLVFNDIPPPDQGHTPIDNEQWAKPIARKSEREEDDAPSDSPDTRNSRATSVTSSSYFQPIRRPITTDIINGDAVTGRANTIGCHRDNSSNGAKDCDGDNNRPPSQRGSFTLHIRPIYSFSPTTAPHRSDLDMLNTPLSSDGNSIQEAQRESAARHQERNTEENGDDRDLCDGNQVKATKYRDIGVMVSPRIHQRTENHNSSDEDNGDHRLWTDEGDCSNSRTEPRLPNTFPQMLPHKGNQQDQLSQLNNSRICTASVASQIHGYPTYLPHVSERLNLKAEVGDIHCPRTDSFPAWVYGPDSTKYPSLLFTNNGSLSIDDSESLKTIHTELRDACNIDPPARLTSSDYACQLSKEVCQDANTLCSDTLHVIDDIPGESLLEYIERKERELLGTDELPTSYVDNSLLSAQDACHSQTSRVSHTDVINEARCSSPRKVVQQPVHEEGYSPFHQYQRLPSPGEVLNREIESELTSFWQPNHMIWY